MSKLIFTLILLSSLSGVAAAGDEAKAKDVKLAMTASDQVTERAEPTVTPLEAEQLFVRKKVDMQKKLDNQLESKFSESLSKEVF